MADELDYIKIKVGQEKTNAYSQGLEKLRLNLEKDTNLTKENITKSIADLGAKMTTDLKLSTKDKQELISNIASNTATTLNPFLSEDKKIKDANKFANDVNQEMKKSEKRSIPKSLVAAAGRLGERINKAKNTFVKKAQEANPFKKKEGPGR